MCNVPSPQQRYKITNWNFLGDADVATTAGGSELFLSHEFVGHTVRLVRFGSDRLTSAFFQHTMFSTMVHILPFSRISRWYLPTLSCLCLPSSYYSFSIALPFFDRTLKASMSTEVCVEDPYIWLEDVEAEESLAVSPIHTCDCRCFQMMKLGSLSELLFFVFVVC